MNRDNTPSTISVQKTRKTRSDKGRLQLEAEPVTFRTAEKTPVDGELTLNLDDFAEDKHCEGIDNLRVSIPYNKLCNILGKAEMKASYMQIDRAEEESVE
ncbi:hypothetical protein FNAPI_6231 [Fusarium napiforme]|uniref:Uncharacterized protein n=1 Tax=Fusarium napiforme TaxID=42672 RepID=A0A8H5JH18_9HYPO|nr:hypothetical protein FNAPI_6231 [Fusarium napiforme]